VRIGRPAEGQVRLDQVGCDRQRIVTPGQPAVISDESLFEHLDHQREIAPAQGAERLCQMNHHRCAGNLGSGGQPLRFGNRLDRLVMPPAGGQFNGQRGICRTDINDIAKVSAQFDHLTGQGVTELMPPEEQGGSGDDVER
jgi:hypothetical protein